MSMSLRNLAPMFVEMFLEKGGVKPSYFSGPISVFAVGVSWRVIFKLIMVPTLVKGLLVRGDCFLEDFFACR